MFSWSTPRLFLFSTLGLTFFSGSALAQQEFNTSGLTVASPPSRARGYGMAGCGLGSILLPNGPQAMTSLVNSLAWNQVFMISSGTSNCQSENLRTVMNEQEQFIAHNFRDVAREAAQGDGENLKGLAQTLGCHSTDQSLFARFTQDHYQEIFSQPGALAALNSLKTRLSSHPQLSTSCKYAALPTGREQTH